MSTQPHVESIYVSLDVHEDADGLYYTEYAQWDTACAIKVWPVTKYDDHGRKILDPRTHGDPLLSIMTRMDVRDRLPELLAFVLRGQIKY